MFAAMRLQWVRARLGMYRGTLDGVVLAQVANVVGPSGADGGWMVWIHNDRDDLGPRYPNEDEAMAAAEAALDERPTAG
jgi:hypothetical protein